MDKRGRRGPGDSSPPRPSTGEGFVVTLLLQDWPYWSRQHSETCEPPGGAQKRGSTGFIL